MREGNAFRPSNFEYAQPEDQFAFAQEIFGSRVPLGVRPTLDDLAYFRQHGEPFATPGTYGHSRGAQRESFGNAYRAVEADPSLTHVQGFVHGFAGFVYPRAWCVDASGQLVELTYDSATANGSERYFGVRFSRFELAVLIAHGRTFDWYEGFSGVLRHDASLRADGGRT